MKIDPGKFRVRAGEKPRLAKRPTRATCPRCPGTNARLVVSRILLDTLGGLGLDYPKLDAKHKRELAVFRKWLK